MNTFNPFPNFSLIFGATAALAFTLTFPAAAENLDSAPWRIAIPANAGPYSTVEGSEAAGFDIDLIKASAQISAHSIIFIPSDSTADALASLNAGEVDAVSGVSFDRASSLPETAILSANYRTEQLVGYANSDALLRDSDDLPHASIAAPLGSAAHRYAKTRGWKTVDTDSWPAAFKIVDRGEADATICDPATANQQLLDGGFKNLHALPGIVHESGISLALAPNAASLADGVLATQQTGHASYLANRWGLAANREAPPAWLNAGVDYRVLAYGGLVLLAALLVLTRKTSRRRPNPGGVTTTPVVSPIKSKP
ncbi:MAG: ABC-type amino acid transport substrate-binding protein [Verrucomicrobiales bacterium]|jgi:ABC-type amino acid transport substrate-binding protein